MKLAGQFAVATRLPKDFPKIFDAPNRRAQLRLVEVHSTGCGLSRFDELFQPRIR